MGPRGDRPVLDGPARAACVEQVLVPERAPGPVAVPDDLAPRRNAEAARTTRHADRRLPLLPPCGPQLNPIGMACPTLEAHLRRIGARTVGDISDAIAEVRELFPPQDRRTHVKAAG